METNPRPSPCIGDGLDEGECLVPHDGRLAEHRCGPCLDDGFLRGPSDRPVPGLTLAVDAAFGDVRALPRREHAGKSGSGDVELLSERRDVNEVNTDPEDG